MIDISFLALPNIAGMRFARYLQVFGSILIFGICLFFVLYFWIRYRRAKNLSKQLNYLDQHTEEIEKELVLKKIHKSSGKELVVLFIDYLERFVTNKTTEAGPIYTYATLTELLIYHGFTAKEAEKLADVLYAGKKISKQIEKKIKIILNTNR